MLYCRIHGYCICRYTRSVVLETAVDQGNVLQQQLQ